MSRSGISALSLFVLIVAAGGLLMIRGLLPPDLPSAVFSTDRAFSFLERIAARPHSSGTAAHDSVKAYITNYCIDNGLETNVQSATGIKRQNNRLIAGAAYNIIARLKGQEAGNVVLIAGHYDSQPNTSGAGDNGCAVAAMLETIYELKKGPVLKHDVIFLFTDLEEPGQLGADAFVRNYPGMDSIGVVLNFDARGNAGVNYIFEAAGDNEWLMQQMSLANAGPVSHSLAYDVYRYMPNASDFTVFKLHGLRGLNVACIDGYANYHMMTDDAAHLDKPMLAQQGTLMLKAAQHFANAELSHHPHKNAVFFNVGSSRLWIYSYTVNNILVILAAILFFICLVVLFKREKLTLKSLLTGFCLFLLSLLLLASVVWVMQWALLALYPQYHSFNSGNSYNAKYYLLSLAGIMLLVYALMYNFFGRRVNRVGLFAGALLMLILLMVGMKWLLPSGVYVLYLPLIPLLIITFFDIEYEKHPELYAILAGISWLLPLLIWGTFTYIFFIVFSLSFLYASTICLLFFVPLLIIATPIFAPINKAILPLAAVIILSAGFVIAQVKSPYTRENPLPTELMYAINHDKQEAMWFSSMKYKDDWVTQYIPAKQESTFDDIYPGFGFTVWKGKAPYHQLETSTTQVLQDTLVNGKRQIALQIIPAAGATSLEFLIGKESKFTAVGDRTLEEKEADGVRRLYFYAPPKEGIIVHYSFSNEKLILITKWWGIPEELLQYKMAGNMIFGPGYMSNSMQLKQTISF